MNREWTGGTTITAHLAGAVTTQATEAWKLALLLLSEHGL